MKLPRLVLVFRVRINYLSGNSIELDFRSLSYSEEGNKTTIKWELDDVKQQQFVLINVERIESIIQLGWKRRIRWV